MMFSQECTKSVAIIGAGFSGIGMAYKLKLAGYRDVVIYERAQEIGGTWRDNRYPGAACDVPSYLYSYAFAQNPAWTNMFAQSEEIQAYLLDCVTRFGVREWIRFGVEVNRLEYDEKNHLWTIYGSSGLKARADIVVMAIGALSNPRWPTLRGMETFCGQMVHTARWPDGIELKDKRVGVLGTGASAIQVVPAIVDEVQSLDVYQRTPAWIVPKMDRKIHPIERWCFKHLPGVQRVVRTVVYWLEETVVMGMLWQGRMAKYLQSMAQKQLNVQIQDTKLKQQLQPDYRIGCKRMLISNTFYPSLCKPQTTLFTQSVKAMDTGGIVLEDGTHRQLDILIMATGFEVPTDSMPMEIKGADDRCLTKQWANGAEGYKGVMVSGFPNFFMLMGPNTAPGHTSVLVYVEAQIGYILKALKTMEKRNIASLDVKPDVQDRFNIQLQKRMKGTVWTSGGCHSWYLTDSGKNTTIWPDFSWRYCLMMSKFRLNAMNIKRTAINAS